MNVEQISSTRQTQHKPYNQLIAMKRWADRSLYQAVGTNFGQLKPEDASVMLRILDHMHTVDKIFQHHLQGLPHTFAAARSEVMPDLGALVQGADAVDSWYVSYVNSLREDDFDQPLEFVFTSGKPARMTRGEIILHVCLHGAYHRGNAGALLQLRGFAPGADGFTNFLEDAGGYFR